ncbi:hypothetical protein K7472_18880 [Streptomyces sp. PTM05]|uniref:Uncharacterized protein n=1 Tax=Streptantibioticus parmotrematis TaxID=2873249 RepID=A0ABS7QVG7_9ACTN|nr:hypothetical protein [Streptantibioticus parmotrematis]MBY8886908.1 hypothetical protein [Streptantibioticus parmotrematis]
MGGPDECGTEPELIVDDQKAAEHGYATGWAEAVAGARALNRALPAPLRGRVRAVAWVSHDGCGAVQLSASDADALAGWLSDHAA